LTVTLDDARLWAEWLFYLPGDAFIAQFGPTTLGGLLDLSPTHFGSATSALLSVALWLAGILGAYYVWAFLLDAANPTLRQEHRERRQAVAKTRRARKHLERRICAGRFLRRFVPWLIVGLVAVLLAVLALALLKDIL
jgi:hypothetical protein